MLYCNGRHVQVQIGKKAGTMQIAICDDEEKMQRILHGKIEEICRETGMAYRILCYSSGEELLSSGERPDLLFLDIQMPGRDGMNVAEELRRRQWDTILIFVTALSEYVYDAFDVGAFHYLVKPFRDEKLRTVLIRASEQYKKQCQTAHGTQGSAGHSVIGGQYAFPEQAYDAGRQAVVLVKRGGVSTAVPVESIIYAEVFNRKITLHTTNRTLEYYGKLTDLSQQVGDHFYRTHRAYLVNLKYVEKYDAATIWLEQGKVPVSKKQFAGFVKQYMRYIGGRG